MKYLIVFFTLYLFLFPAHSAIEAYQFKDAATEETYKELIHELRCLVCQNQNLADSDADLAKDLRQQTYEMLQQGKGREQIVKYMVERYGDFVLYRPPLKSNTFLLWIGPFVLLLLVLIVIFTRFRKKQVLEAPEEQAMNQAKGLLSDEPTKNEKNT